MKKTEKAEKPAPKRCVCGAEAILVKTRSGKMFTCPDPMNYKANLRTTWHKHQDLAITEWNSLVGSFYARTQNKGGKS